MKGNILALCGGVGGAKLALGLATIIDPDRLTVIVNTGDDFTHLGLHISPDIDTVLYTLAGLADPSRGWGLADETWGFMGQVAQLGGDDWFCLGDRDLAAHVLRTHRLSSGETLSSITQDFALKLGIGPRIIAMSDGPVRTVLKSGQAWLNFQDYFVRHRAEPRISQIVYEGAQSAKPSPQALEALADPDLACVLICPSNPWLSIGPMLAMSELKEAVARSQCPVLSVSPIIAGAAVKGPTAKIMEELGLDVAALSVAHFYGDLVQAHIIDPSHAHEQAAFASAGYQTLITPTLMTTAACKTELARNVLAFAADMQA